MRGAADTEGATRPSGGDRPRLLWVIKGLGPGGAENLLVQQARVRGDEFDLTVAYAVAAKSQLVPSLEATGTTVVCIAGQGRLGPIRELRRLIANADVVHTHSPVLGALVRLLARTVSRRPRLVYTEHNRWPSYRRPTRLINWAAFGLDDVSLAVSEDAASSMSKRARGRTSVLQHGIDIAAARHQADRGAARAELSVDDSTLVVGIVANCREEKDLRNLVQAVEYLRATWPDSRIRVVHIGQGPLERRFAQWHEQSQAGSWLRRLGHRPDAVSLMAGFDVCTLSSLHEGLPVVLMEAAALGLPMVAPEVGGVGSICVNGENGLLVPASDPGALAAGWRWLEEHPTERAVMGSRSAEIAERFDVRRASAELRAAYLGEAVGTGQPGSS